MIAGSVFVFYGARIERCIKRAVKRHIIGLIKFKSKVIDYFIYTYILHIAYFNCIHKGLKNNCIYAFYLRQLVNERTSITLLS